VVGLASVSAGAALIRAGLRVDLTGFGSIIVPGRAASADDVDFVQEGEPIPARSLNISGGPTLEPYKMACLTGFTEELSRRSVPTVEAVIRQLLSESVSLSIDKALFSDEPASAARPAGLLHNIVPQTPTAGGGATAMQATCSTLWVRSRMAAAPASP
jgi:HK97 family phage major capsid protein